MRIVFTWQPKEWRELHLLSTAAESRRRGSQASMSYFVIALMALGGVGDVVHTLRSSRYTGVHGTLLPVLLGVLLLLVLVFAALALWRSRRRLRGMPPLPQGEQQVVLQEGGWSSVSTASAVGEIQPWSNLRGQRENQHVIALLTRSGEPVGVPRRAVTVEQASWMHRLFVRKVLSHARQVTAQEETASTH